MLGKRELQERLAQRENVLAQRDAEIAVLTRRVEEIEARESRQQAELEGYRARSEAIVSALTEAQHSAARIRQEAEAYKDEVTGSAYEQRDAAHKEAEEIVRQGYLQAEEVLNKAKEQAAQIKADADTYLAAVEQRAAGLKERLRQAAQEARQQADAFGSFVLDIGSANIGRVSAPEAEAALPEGYSSPAALMQNIYALQGRDLPQEDSEAQPEPQTEAQPGQEIEPEEGEPAAGPEDLGEEAEPAQEQVFSVSEILAAGAPVSAQAEGPASAPVELDSIIDDILRGV